MILGILYLLFSGYTSIKAINIREFYDETLDDIISENDGKLTIKNSSTNEKMLLYYKNIKLNQLINNIKSNYVYATFIGIRNGIILISIFFMLIWI